MKTANTVFGQSAGKLAGVVASRWKGINVVREKPLTVNQPNTVAQLNQRARMRLAVFLAKMNLPFLQMGYKEQAIHQSAYNEGVRQLLKGITASAGTATFTVPNNVSYAKGSLANIGGPISKSFSGDNCIVDWTDNSNGGNILSTDNVWLVAVKPSTNEIYYGQMTATRSAETGNVLFPVDVHIGFSIYVFTTRASEGKSSDSLAI